MEAVRGAASTTLSKAPCLGCDSLIERIATQVALAAFRLSAKNAPISRGILILV